MRKPHWRVSLALGCALIAALLVAGAPPAHGGTAKPAFAEIAVAELPREARETLELVRKGGPFPHDRDGIVFGNFEKLLPRKDRGYYREYTVRTPGVKHRGARRIVAGGCPGAAREKSGGADGRRSPAPCDARELYYTEDHYKSFRRIKP